MYVSQGIEEIRHFRKSLEFLQLPRQFRKFYSLLKNNIKFQNTHFPGNCKNQLSQLLLQKNGGQGLKNPVRKHVKNQLHSDTIVKRQLGQVSTLKVILNLLQQFFCYLFEYLKIIPKLYFKTQIHYLTNLIKRSQFFQRKNSF